MDVADDTTFQPAEFTGEKPLRKLIAAQIHIVSDTVKHPIDAQPRCTTKVVN